MYRIALCDDVAAELDRVEALLTAYGREKRNGKYVIDRYGSGEALLAAVSENLESPDMLLLDIFMSGKTGLETALELRRLGIKAPIIFLTTSPEYALEAYEVDALQYIVKPIEKKRFFHAIDVAFEMLKKAEKELIVIRVAGGVRQLRPNAVIYCETQKNYQVLHLEETDLRVRMTSGEMYGILERFPQFCRCGSSYILNMQHIAVVEKEEINMDNGSRIYIPKNKTAEFRKTYFSYYFDT